MEGVCITLAAMVSVLVLPFQSAVSIATTTLANVTCSGANGCSMGYYCANDTCQCLQGPARIVKCSEEGNDFAVLNCYSATSAGANQSHLQVGASALYCRDQDPTVASSYHHYRNVYANYDTCKSMQLNRTGVLCGRCLSDHYPLAYSYSFDCAQCHHVHWNWVRYIMAAYLPLTFFYFAFVFCKINIVSSHLHPVVFFSQAMSMPPFVRVLIPSIPHRAGVLTSGKVLLSLYGIWNLDFFRPFYSDLCLGIGILPTLALDYAIAVYPLLLMIISYLLIVMYDKNYRVVTIIWRPFRVLFSLFRKNWDIRTSVIDAFSAFILLTNVKFLSASFDLLTPTRVYHLYGNTYNHTTSLFYAADIEYFGSEHLPYAILAIAMLCIFVILPIALLVLYPFAFFQKFLNLFPVRWYILHTFVDAFQGCYKDGTEPGTRDFRWFSATYLGFRSLFFLLYGITLNGSYFAIASLLMLLIVVALVAFQPYKNRFAQHFKTNTVFVLLYIMYYTVILSIERAMFEGGFKYLNFLYFVAFTLATVPLCCIAGFVLYWVLSRCKCCLGVGKRLCWWRRGYVAVDGDDIAADAYCDRAVNPQAYPTAGHLEDWSSMNMSKEGEHTHTYSSY